MTAVAVYWARRDFRLSDNPALTAAVNAAKKAGGALCPVFVLEDYMCAGDPNFQFGYPQRLFLSKALPIFAKNFNDFLVVRGTGAAEIERVCNVLRDAGYAPEVYVNEDVYADFYTQVSWLRTRGFRIHVAPDQMTVDPETKTETGKRYSVFTPFKMKVWKQFLESPVLPAIRAQDASCVPGRIFRAIDSKISADEPTLLKEFSTSRTFAVQGAKSNIFDIDTLVAEKPCFDGWYASEHEAQDMFSAFCAAGLHYYADTRDSLRADVTGGGTSRMSLALTWGLVSARYLKDQIKKEYAHDFVGDAKEPAMHLRAPVTYVSELVWREFYKYLLFHDPKLLDREFQERYRGTIVWVPEQKALKRFTAWIKGETGYPLVDAAMKQIAALGWMHNRSRMVVSSVLTKNFGVDWRWGQEYFRAQLFDLDEASNNGGWQWGASVGADPKPIRIFNPYLQAKKYDPAGTYQKHWLGETRERNDPIVDHVTARTEALVRYGLRNSRLGLRGRQQGMRGMF